MITDADQYPVIPVSRFDPFTDRHGIKKPGIVPQQDDLYRELFNFKNGYYAQLIGHLRKLVTKKEKDKFKAENLPAFTFSAVVEEHRHSNHVKNHTGILVIDIDNEGILPYIKKRQEQDNDFTIESFRNEVARLTDTGFTNILFSGLSASGNGVFLMFLIQPEHHLLCFESIKWEFENLYGIKIDRSCSDVVRLRFCTHDPGAIIRSFSEVTIYQPPQAFLDWKIIQDKRKEELKSKTRAFVSNAQAATQILNTAITLIEDAKQGERHTKTRAAARLLGGYVATGVLTVEYAREILRATVDSKIGWDDPKMDAYRTIDWGLEKGQLSPLHLHVINPDDPQFETFVELNEERQQMWKQFYYAILDYNRSGIPFSDIEFDVLCQKFGIDPDRGVSIATRLYRENSDEFNFEKLVKPVKLKVFLKKRWEIRRNVVSNDLFIRVKGSGNPWKKLILEDLWISACEQGFNVSWEDMNRLMNTELVDKYNPFVDYFTRSLKAYDGHTDYIDKLSSFITVRGVPDGYFSMMLKKMMVRAVKCALEDSYINRFVFVLASQYQNTGKSWLIRWLSPWGMNAYYTENPMEDSKDGRIRMSEVFIYNLEELSTVSKWDVNRLKATISQGSVRERRPYERQAETFSRRCSFFGSTNRTDFLIDDINTRWLIFEIDKIDWNYREELQVVQLWGQAYSLYKNGFDCELTKEEGDMRDNQNMYFVEVTNEENLALRWFAPCDIGSPFSKVMSASDIMFKIQELCDNPKIPLSLQNLGRTLRRAGFRSVHYGRARGYVVQPIHHNPDGCADLRDIYGKTLPTRYDAGKDIIPPDYTKPDDDSELPF